MTDDIEGETSKQDTFLSTVARPDFDPFAKAHDDYLKFVRLSGERIKALTADKNRIVDPAVLQKGAIFWGSMTQDHKMIVALNLGISPDEAKDVECIDSGMVVRSDDTNAAIMNVTSGELKHEGNVDPNRLTVEQKAEIHRTTAEFLNSIYDTEQASSRYKFEVAPTDL